MLCHPRSTESCQPQSRAAVSSPPRSTSKPIVRNLRCADCSTICFCIDKVSLPTGFLHEQQQFSPPLPYMLPVLRLGCFGCRRIRQSRFSFRRFYTEPNFFVELYLRPKSPPVPKCLQNYDLDKPPLPYNKSARYYRHRPSLQTCVTERQASKYDGRNS